MKSGESLLLQAPNGRLQSFMAQIRVDIGRVGGDASTFNQSHILGIEPSTRTVLDIVKVTRL